jgi:hypothetical protein
MDRQCNGDQKEEKKKTKNTKQKIKDWSTRTAQTTETKWVLSMFLTYRQQKSDNCYSGKLS